METSREKKQRLALGVGVRFYGTDGNSYSIARVIPRANGESQKYLARTEGEESYECFLTVNESFIGAVEGQAPEAVESVGEIIHQGSVAHQKQV